MRLEEMETATNEEHQGTVAEGTREVLLAPCHPVLLENHAHTTHDESTRNNGPINTQMRSDVGVDAFAISEKASGGSVNAVPRITHACHRRETQERNASPHARSVNPSMVFGEPSDQRFE